MWNERLINELNEASCLLEGLLNNTLDITKLEEGKLEFDTKFEAIYSIVDIVLSISESKALKKNIKLVADYGANVPPLIELDKTRITQVLMNLVGNAIKFTGVKGKIRIKVRWDYDVAVKDKLCKNSYIPKVKSKFAINRNNPTTPHICGSRDLLQRPNISHLDEYIDKKNTIPDELVSKNLKELPSKTREYVFTPTSLFSMKRCDGKGASAYNIMQSLRSPPLTSACSSGPNLRKSKKEAVSSDGLHDSFTQHTNCAEYRMKTPSSTRNSGIFITYT